MSKAESMRPTAVFLRGVMKGLEKLFPGHAIILLVAPIGTDAANVNYIANAQRQDMIAVMKEVAGRLEGCAHDAPAMRQ